MPLFCWPPTTLFSDLVIVEPPQTRRFFFQSGLASVLCPRISSRTVLPPRPVSQPHFLIFAHTLSRSLYTCVPEHPSVIHPLFLPGPSCPFFEALCQLIASVLCSLVSRPLVIFIEVFHTLFFKFHFSILIFLYNVFPPFLFPFRRLTQ